MAGRLKGIAGLLLILIGIPWTFVGLAMAMGGITLMAQGCEPTAPVCRNLGLPILVLAALVLAVGLVHLVAGVGIRRRSRVAVVLGWLVAIVGAIGGAWVVLSGFYGGNQVAIVVAVSLVPYLVVLALLILEQRSADHGPSPPVAVR